MRGTQFRYCWAMWGALPLLAGLMLLSVAKGSVPLSLAQVLGALRLLDVPVSEMIGRIVIDLRVPRTLLSVLAGAVLAIVGGLLQTTTRNDLADPFFIWSLLRRIGGRGAGDYPIRRAAWRADAAGIGIRWRPLLGGGGDAAVSF